MLKDENLPRSIDARQFARCIWIGGQAGSQGLRLASTRFFYENTGTSVLLAYVVELVNWALDPDLVPDGEILYELLTHLQTDPPTHLDNYAKKTKLTKLKY